MGWYLDTCQLLVKLPLHKLILWAHHIDTVINRKILSCKMLQSINGRLETMTLVV